MTDETPPTAESRDRIRTSYDAVADEYQHRLGDELSGKPLDRALLGSLLEQALPGAPIADLGCGPGHIAGWLTSRGASVVGVDLSPAMVKAAERTHPEAEFRVGDLLELPAEHAEFGAAVAAYAIVHLEPHELRPAFAEMHRTLRPGAPLLLSFHIGTELRHMDDWWGHPVNLDFRFFEVAAVTEALTDAGLTTEATMTRAPYPHEVATQRAYLLARAR